MDRKAWFDVLREGFEFPEISRDTSLPETVKTVINALNSHLKNSPAITEYLTALPKGLGTDCPDSPVEELQKYAAIRMAKIDKSDPAVNAAFMEKIMGPRAVFERLMILKGVRQIDDVSLDEYCLFTFGSGIAELHDALWAKWQRELVVPFHSLPTDEKAKEEERLSRVLNQYDYTVIKDGQRLPWALAFPKEIGAINLALKYMAVNLSYRKEASAIKEYLWALQVAYTCEDVAELEKRWAEVDLAWIKIPVDCRVFPVHGMESVYEHPFGVSPEFRLMVRTDIGKDTIKGIREATSRCAELLGADPAMIKNKLAYMDIGVFYTAIWSGMCLNFRYSGQVVPNRQDILAQGGKIFIDQDSIENSVMATKKAIEENCTAETVALLEPLIDSEIMLADIVSHECFHPAGRSPESDMAIGVSEKLLEEGKATLGGLWVCSKIGNSEERLKMVAVMVGRFCRFFHRSRLSSPSDASYVRENMIACNLMHEAGVVILTDGGLAVNKELAMGSAWFDKIEGFVRQVIESYKNKDKEAFEKLHDKYCRQEGFLLEVINWVNRQ